MSTTGTKDFTLKYKRYATPCMKPRRDKGLHINAQSLSTTGQHNGHVKHKQMAWSKAYENRKRANIYHSDMENERVQRYRRIMSTMFNDGVINMGRVLVLFAFMSQMGQHYSMHGSFGTFTMLF